jgi:predicted metal-dependent hydrolase
MLSGLSFLHLNMKLEYNLIRSKRRTLALHITKEGGLEVRAPLKMSLEFIEAFVVSKQKWFAKHKQRMQESQPVPKSFVEGEQFLFLGKQYPLQFSDEQPSPVELSDTLCLATRLQSRAGKVITGWYRLQATQILADRVEHFSVLMSIKPKQIKINNAGQRWGSCSPNGNVNFSWRLVMAPLEIIDYVVVHELAHLLRHDHSGIFWSKVEAILPDYKLRRKWLKDNGRLLIF